MLENSSIWNQFKGEEYELKDLGRPAVFLLPNAKLQIIGREGITIEKGLHTFLTNKFGAFTQTKFPAFGFWRDNKSEIVYDECIQYEVSFLGKEHIPDLLLELSHIAADIGEDCLYFKAGQRTCLIYPKD